MDSAARYRTLGNPGRSEHLWRYTPWKRVHPSGKTEEIPEMGKPILSLSHIDGSEVSEGISLRNGIEGSDLFFGDELTNTFLDASSIDSRWTLEIEKHKKILLQHDLEKISFPKAPYQPAEITSYLQ